MLLASSSANDSDATTVLLDSTAANASQATAPAPASSTLREGADNRDSASSAEEVNQGEHFLTTSPCKLC